MTTHVCYLQSALEEQLLIASQVVQRKEQVLFKEREHTKTLGRQVSAYLCLWF